MKIGIVGFPQSGKKTLFKLLTGADIKNSGGDSVPGIADIRDERFNSLVRYCDPRKVAPAQIAMDLMPDLDKRVIQEGNIFRDIANLDALCLVVRSFRNDAIYHVNGSVDAERDIDEITGEFLLHDMLFIEKRFERIELSAKKKGLDELQKKEQAVLGRLKEQLENDLPLRECEIPEEEMKIIVSYPFITLKEMVIVLNAGDNELGSDILKNRLIDRYKAHGIKIMQISAKLECEIQSLESDQERAEFMQASSITEPAINQLSRLCMEALGLISFFTVGKDEVKQWLVRAGSLAPVAAGVIHSDIERGFIRAEVMKYDDLMLLGSEEKVKLAGKHYVMGRDYPIEDGDIVNFRFNV